MSAMNIAPDIATVFLICGVRISLVVLPIVGTKPSAGAV